LTVWLIDYSLILPLIAPIRDRQNIVNLETFQGSNIQVNNMNGKNFLIFLTTIMTLFFAFSADAFDRHPAHSHWRYHGPRFNHGYFGIYYHSPYYFYDYDGWYLSELGNSYYLVFPPVGAVVSWIPDEYRMVSINGRLYYTWNNNYFIRTVDGYQVVAPPAVISDVKKAATNQQGTTQAQITNGISPEGTIILNIPDGKGKYIPVTIKRSGNGFIGPQGEFYQQFPKVSQLQVIYATNR
jgi:hypothetical protein